MKFYKIGLVVIAFILVLFGVLAILNRPNNYQVTQGFATSANFSEAIGYGNDSAVFPNNNSFTAYDYMTGQSSSLGPNNSAGGLSGIDSLVASSDGHYLLFHDEQAVQGGFLYNQLVNNGQDPTLDYWWVYNTSSYSFTPLPQGIVLAKFSGDSVVALAASNGGEALTTYSPGAFKATSTTTVPGSSNFFPVSGGYLLQSPNNSVLFTKNGTLSQTLYKSMVLVGTDADGQTAVGVNTENSTHQLVLLNISKDTQKVIADNVVNQPVWLTTPTGGEVLYSTTSTGVSSVASLSTYSTVSHKKTFIEFVGSAQNLAKLNLTPVALIGVNTAIVSSTSTNFYLIGSGLSGFSY